MHKHALNIFKMGILILRLQTSVNFLYLWDIDFFDKTKFPILLRFNLCRKLLLTLNEFHIKSLKPRIIIKIVDVLWTIFQLFSVAPRVPHN